MKNFVQITFTNEIEWRSLSSFHQHLSNTHTAVIITEKNIFEKYRPLFELKNKILVLEISESVKTLSTAEKIWNFLMKENISRSQHIFIIGGGTLHDIALFSCSVFKRGLRCVAVPSTLLSMVDASIGGKNALNYQHTKNILGTIYLPIKNIIISEFLNSLSQEQMMSGWAEILKIALVKDASFYHLSINELQKSYLPNTSVILKAIQLKLNIIQKDPSDTNERQLLNYGHTIAHAIEGLYDEKQKYIPHGYAVILGILIENHIAQSLHITPSNIVQKIYDDISQHFSLHYLHTIQKEDITSILQKIKQDKKNTPAQIYFTLIEDIGQGKIKIPIHINNIKDAVYQFLKLHHP